MSDLLIASFTRLLDADRDSSLGLPVDRGVSPSSDHMHQDHYSVANDAARILGTIARPRLHFYGGFESIFSRRDTRLTKRPTPMMKAARRKLLPAVPAVAGNASE
ncbi:hypothetical protein ACFV16_34855 [Streptomyces massasporeus]|uniref:hypothetical protein n=1 Tax=Streptomyces massasporeus TaxID=67324 RepID=UPI003680B4AE